MNEKSRVLTTVTDIYDRLFLHRGWEVAYLVYLLCFSMNIKSWLDLKRQFRMTMKEYHSDLLAEKPLSYWIREFFHSFFVLGADLELDYYGSLMIGQRWSHKKKIVTARKRLFSTKYLNCPEMNLMCWDKARSAEMWAEWYHRRWCKISQDSPITAEQLKRIANGKSKVIVKPNDSSGGDGIFSVDVSTDEMLEKAVDQINCLDRNSIIEELIIQKGLLHDLNPASVNTCRIITAKHANGEIELLCTYLRLGGAGSVVDNFSSGGVQYVIDKETGTLGIGSNGLGQCYTVHPTTGMTVTGVRISNWQEAVEFCFSAHRHAPDGFVIAGWDVCISDDGMSLVEVNSRACYCQLYDESEDHWGAIKKLLTEYDEAREKTR